MSDYHPGRNGPRFQPPMESVPLSPIESAPFAEYRATPPLPSSSPLSQQTPRQMTRNPSFPPPATAGLQPYLLLPSRLSLTILSLPLLSLILSIVALLSSSSHAQQSVQDAQARILATCKGVEKGVGWVEGLPRIMAEKVNEQVVSGVKASLRGLRVVLMDSLTIMEKVLEFMIDTYRSLLMCTIQLAVQGTLSILIGAVELISTSVTSSLNTIRTSIQSDIASANSLITSAVSSINSVTSLVNVRLSVPQFAIPSLTGLANVTIPTTFEDDLRKLNASIPTLEEVKKAIDALIELPFGKLRSELNVTFTDLAGRFNTSLLPVPGVRNSNYTSALLATSTTPSSIDLCSTIDTSFLTDISKSLAHLRKIGLALLILAFFLLWLGLIAWEWWTYKSLVGQAENVEEMLEKDARQGRRVDGMRIVGVVEHPVVERYVGSFMDGWMDDPEKRNSSRWFFAFITHGPALALLLFGILTFFVAQFQIAAVTSLRAQSVSSTSAAINASSTSLSAQLNAAAYNQSARYAIEMNMVLAGWQDTIDDEVFGPWLNTTTLVLNNTLVQFYAEITSIINTTIGGTILAAPVNTFLYCILGSKIDNLETALTWVRNNAKLTLPTIPVNVLMLSNSSMNSITNPISAAATGSGDDDEGDGVVGTIFDRYLEELRRQRLVAGLFVALWGVVVLVGASVVVWNLWLRSRFVAWRLARAGVDHQSYGGGRGGEKEWDTPINQSQMDEKKDLPDVPSRWGGSNHGQKSDSSFLNHPYEAPIKRSVSPIRPFLPSSPGGWKSRLPLPRISSHRPTPIEHDTTDGQARLLPENPRPPMEASTSWSDRLKGAVTTFLTVPAQGVGLGRKISQKSEKSFAGYASSPWDDTSGNYRDSSDRAAPVRPPSPVRASYDDPKHWSMVYPKMDDGSRYPPLPTRSNLNQVSSREEEDPFGDDEDSERVRTPVMQADFQGVGIPRQNPYEHRRSLTGNMGVVQEHFDPRRHPRRVDPFATPFDE